MSLGVALLQKSCKLKIMEIAIEKGDTLTPEILADLKKFNDMLVDIEKQILQKAIELDKHLKTQEIAKQDAIVGYDLMVEISFFWDNDAGDPVCVLREHLKGCLDGRLGLLADVENHNEYYCKENHPMQGDYHCWLFHCLYDHEYLGWGQIIHIKKICWDIKPSCYYEADIDFDRKSNLPKSEPLPIVYSQSFDIYLPEVVEKIVGKLKFPLDFRRFGNIYIWLKIELGGTLAIQNIEPITDEELLLFHTKEYLYKIRSDTSTIGTIIGLEMPKSITASILNEYIIKPIKCMVRGTIKVAFLALQRGWAINIGGGFHHAKSDGGAGFCFFNDYALATVMLRARYPKLKILYVDLDAHLGDGVIEFAKSIQDFYILDIYNTFANGINNTKEGEDGRFKLIGIAPHTEDETYLALLKNHLPSAIEKIKPEFIFYNGGSDVLDSDPLGQLSISEIGMIDRDRFVFEQAKNRNIPIAMCLSGGYGKENYLTVSRSLSMIIKEREAILTTPCQQSKYASQKYRI